MLAVTVEGTTLTVVVAIDWAGYTKTDRIDVIKNTSNTVHNEKKE